MARVAPERLRELAEQVLALLPHIRPAPALVAPVGPSPLDRPGGGPLKAMRSAMSSEAVTLPDASKHRRAPGSGRPRTTGTIGGGHAETWRLVERAQAGDGTAFGELYDRYVDSVYRYIYFRVNDRALAEDFTSETFLRALRRISAVTYQGSDIGAWFVTIARNLVLDHMKSARHRLEVPTGEPVEGDRTVPSTEASVLQTLTADHLLGAVRRLGDEQRECIVLRFIQGLSVSETAEVMGKNDGAIKALQHRAVRKLAELIGGDPR